MARDGYEVVLPSKKVVVLVELDLEELEKVFQLGGSGGGNDFAKNFKVSLEGLRMSVVNVDGKPYSYADLEGNRLKSVFRVKEVLALQSIWNGIHIPDADETAAVKNGLKAVSGI